jgi:hypothetical protein
MAGDAMRAIKRWFCFLYIVASGCDGDTLSVGDLRCQGDGVHCEPPKALSGDETHVETTPIAEVSATLNQIVVAGDGAVYVASAQHVARIELSASQSDTK